MTAPLPTETPMEPKNLIKPLAISVFSFSVRPLARSKAIASGSFTAFSKTARTEALGSASKIWRIALEPAEAAIKLPGPPVTAAVPAFAPRTRRPRSVTMSAPLIRSSTGRLFLMAVSMRAMGTRSFLKFDSSCSVSMPLARMMLAIDGWLREMGSNNAAA